MNPTTKAMIWIPAVLITNVAIWFAFRGLAPLAVLATSIIATLILREIVGTLFYFTNRRLDESSDSISEKLDQSHGLFDDHR
ncbi:MAG: hypothetical protein H6822_18615 [Planctomycetaceae bacterium]|nr:hypothetical protein [Planctomycetales bacterium]MCB9920542.1 hypothetical protein [Planctomycetaceae bacterium]MCB9924201.1 hypothetical protein [Planctomycetaceae bacterium]